MNHILYTTLIIALSGSSLFFTKAQSQPKWDEIKIEQANTAKEIKYLSHEEKEIVYYTNLARIDGPLFASTFLEEYLKKNNIRSNKWIASLKKDLENSPSLSPLIPQKDLSGIARQHAEKSGKTGRTGHFDFKERTKDVMKKYNGIGENCNYGTANGLLIVILLLIDEGVENLGHRKNMLNSDYQYTGVSIERHKKYGFNGVIVYGGKKRQEFSSID
ncbi:MAG: CAP domain-containing protein [Bacteroidetes bacterium]|nr:CAP domain-containing protein [Bacteroidota bacterium]HET6244163.1 CAP domain-containing protein [Bacteroidia bacterium]